MTGSPFSNVLGHDHDSTFVNVLATSGTDTTDFDQAPPAFRPEESSLGVIVDPNGNVHVAAQDETAGQANNAGLPPS